MVFKGIKTIMYIALPLVSFLGFGSGIAYAEDGSGAWGNVGWKGGEFAAKQGVSPNAKLSPADQFGPVLTQVVTAFCGVAVVVFVFRIVITAVDRMVFGGSQFNSIPLVGSYKNEGDTQAWGNIFRKFAVQLAIVAGTWIIVSLVAGIVLQLLSVASGDVSTSGSAGSADASGFSVSAKSSGR